jgi:ribosomal protein S28E/S33
MKKTYMTPEMTMEEIILENVMMFSGSKLPGNTGSEGDIAEVQMRISESIDLESKVENWLW